MKEVFEKLPVAEGRIDYFLDTCFLYWIFEHDHVKDLEDFCEKNKVAITSFNAEEFIYHSKDVQSEIRVRFRSFVKRNPRLYYFQINVSPGDAPSEKKFIEEYDPKLAEIIPDPSDAVLIVVALKQKANVLTRDKHHLFTTILENHLQDKKIKVLNVFPK